MSAGQERQGGAIPKATQEQGLNPHLPGSFLLSHTGIYIRNALLQVEGVLSVCEG